MGICNLYYIKYQIDDLKANQILKQVSISKLKREFDILVIDDDEFPLLTDLQKHEFNIAYRQDISDIKDVEPYQIILCDINGVGKFLGSDSDGAYLGYQIKNKYPEKIVISYTADNTSVKNQKYIGAVDEIIPKGTSIEDWASLLDNTIKGFADPIKAWKKIQSQLIDANVSTKEIAKIEHRYVRAVKTSNLKSLEKLSSGSSEVANIVSISLQFLITILKSIQLG